MIRLRLTGSRDGLDVEDMGFDRAAAIHARGDGAFVVLARPSGSEGPFRRMSIAVEHVVRIDEVDS